MIEIMVAVFALASVEAGARTAVGPSIGVEYGDVEEARYDDEVRPLS